MSRVPILVIDPQRRLQSLLPKLSVDFDPVCCNHLVEGAKRALVESFALVIIDGSGWDRSVSLNLIRLGIGPVVRVWRVDHLALSSEPTHDRFDMIVQEEKGAYALVLPEQDAADGYFTAKLRALIEFDLRARAETHRSELEVALDSLGNELSILQCQLLPGSAAGQRIETTLRSRSKQAR